MATFAEAGLRGDFLKLKETRALFRKEQHFPSALIDRGFARPDGSTPSIVERAQERVEELLSTYERRALTPECEQEIAAFVEAEGGLTGLTELLGSECARGT